MNSAALAQIEVEPSFAEAVSPSATDESRKWAMRSSACWFGGQLRGALGDAWAEQLGIDRVRADQWAPHRFSEGTALPAPREVMAMAYVLGLPARVTFLCMVGLVDLGAMKPEVDRQGVVRRTSSLFRRQQFPAKAYRSAEVEEVLQDLQGRGYSAAEARRYLATRMGVSESSLGQIARGNVAASTWADAALALEMGRPLQLHWSLLAVQPDRAYLCELDAAHRQYGRMRQGLVDLAFEGLEELKITAMDQENSFVIVPFGADLTLAGALVFRQLDETLVLKGADGRRWSLQVVQQRVDGDLAKEVGVDETPWLEFRLYQLDREGWVTGKKMEGFPATWEALAVAVGNLLPEGLDTIVSGVKLQIPDARRHAVAAHKKIKSA